MRTSKYFIEITDSSDKQKKFVNLNHVRTIEPSGGALFVFNEKEMIESLEDYEDIIRQITEKNL